MKISARLQPKTPAPTGSGNPDFLADPDPDSGKKVGTGPKDPDPKHCLNLYAVVFSGKTGGCAGPVGGCIGGGGGAGGAGADAAAPPLPPPHPVGVAAHHLPPPGGGASRGPALARPSVWRRGPANRLVYLIF